MMFRRLSVDTVLKALVFIGLLGLIVLIFSQPIDLTTSDLGRHLANGREILSHREVLYSNFYSYTEPDFPFINHHWLYGVIVYGVYQLTGFIGLSILNIIFILSAFSLAFLIASRKIDRESRNLCGRIRVNGFHFASLLSFPVILLLSERVEVRPEIFSYLFIILTYFLLDKTEEDRKYRRLWLLIPLFIFWVNIHIYFFIGLALVGFKAAAVFLGQDKLISAWRAARIWIMVFASSVLACLINPHTWQGLIYPFTIFKNYGYEVAENKSIFFLEHLMSNGNFFLFKLVFGLLVISWVLYFIFYRPKQGNVLTSTFIIARKRLFDILISIFLAALALMASRNISLFGLVSLMIISANMSPVLMAFRKRNIPKLIRRQRLFKLPFARIYSVISVFFLLIIIGLFFWLISDGNRGNRVINNSFGLGLYEGNDASLAFFQDNHLSGPIFNNYDIGSALIFWFGEEEKVFVDNRPEAYSVPFFTEIYMPMQSEAEKWEEYSRAYEFKTIYFTHTDGTPWAQEFLARILQDEKWRLVYFDAYTVILINTEKYGADEITALNLDIWTAKERMRKLAISADIKHRLRLGGLAQYLGLPELAEEIYRGVLSEAPEHGQTLYSLANLYAGYDNRENRLQAVSYFQRALASGLRLPDVYNNLGLVYWNLSWYSEAEDAWLSALKRDGQNVSALYYLDQVEELKKAGTLPAND